MVTPASPALRRRLATVLLSGLLAVTAGPARPDESEPPRPDRHPELKRLSRTEEVWVDPRAKTVVVGGSVVRADGPLEVFACLEKTKEHEAVVATRSSARLVHAALLAIGLEPGRPVSFHPDYVAARGPVVDVRVRWRDAEGRDQEVRAQDWVRDTRTGKPLAVDWVFAGSTFWRDPEGKTEYYQADGGDLICVANFPEAMLDLPAESSQSNDELLYEVFAGRVPPAGTEVDLVLSAGQAPAAATGSAADPTPPPAGGDR